MTIRIEDVSLVGQAVKVLFDSNKTGVMAFDKTFKDPWEVNIFVPGLADVSDLIGVGGLKKLNKGNTVYRDKGMDNETPILVSLEYNVKKCIENNTIEDSYESFQISEFRESIRAKDIAGFHKIFLILIDRVNHNSGALSTAGFNAAAITSISTNHDLAWEYQGTRIIITGEISELSEDNKAVVLPFLKLCQSTINVIYAYAKSNGMTKLMKQASMAAVLRSVRPTPVKKPRVRNVKALKSIIFQSNVALFKKMQFTKLTQGTVLLGRSETKDGVPTATMELTYNQLLSIKLSDIPGTGRFVKLINPDLTKARVLCFVIG